MTNDSESNDTTSVEAAVEAFRRGWQPIPIRSVTKEPFISSWTHTRWQTEADVRKAFTEWAAHGRANNVGLLLGEPSRGLIDIDLDHPTALRLRDHFLPPTPMRSGRVGRPRSHMWYLADRAEPSTRQYKMPDGRVSVELRGKGNQTVVPPSIHPTGEEYRWEGDPWGGDQGPAVVHGKFLATYAATLALGCVLLDNWPKGGSRHGAYLALAGGLLRLGQGVHPWWVTNAVPIIRALAQVTLDEDGPDAREKESIRTTIAKLDAGVPVVGFPTLAEFIGTDHAEAARRLKLEIEAQAGQSALRQTIDIGSAVDEEEERLRNASTLPPEQRDPLAERGVGRSWQAVDLEPYLEGVVIPPRPTVLERSDGVCLFYEGRVNSLFGQSEGAKTWIALLACVQEIGKEVGNVLYVDLEDEPTYTIERLHLLGCGNEDIRKRFTYVHPENPISTMQRDRYGQEHPTDIGEINAALFEKVLEQTSNPTLVVVDGMMVLYGLHGLDSNDGASTDVVSVWLRTLTRNGKTTVIVIDHTGKNAARGASPIGAHHKIAMIQGTALQVYPVDQPMPGSKGVVELLVYKDRPGEIRKVSGKLKPSVAAVVTLDSRDRDDEGKPIDGMKVSIDPSDPNVVTVTQAQADASARAADRLTRKAQEAAQKDAERLSVLSLFDDGSSLPLAAVVLRIGTSEKVARGHVNALIEQGLLEKVAAGKNTSYKRTNVTQLTP